MTPTAIYDIIGYSVYAIKNMNEFGGRNMNHTLENDRLRITVDDHGAELCSIFDKDNKREILWQADPVFWKRHAPVLFPNVGRHYKDCWRLNGDCYDSRQHGFARDMDFSCTAKTTDSVTHLLTSTDKTRESYPFDFTFSVTHTLAGHDILIRWNIQNTGSQRMYFTIGGHPAFNVPVLEGTEQTDYYLTFEDQTSIPYLLLDPVWGTAQTGTQYRLDPDCGKLRIHPHMFDKDALIFSDGVIQKAGIAFPDGTPYLELTCKGFPNFGIWSVPGAPFICLEPWMGRCDDCGFEGDVSDKPGINQVDPGNTFTSTYSIRIF